MSHHNPVSSGLLAFSLCLVIPATRAAAEVKVPAPAKELITYFQPSPIVGKLTTHTWGAARALPRDIQNGLEDATNKWIYWDSAILRAKDGKYHMFASRWPESLGHGGWQKAVIVHAVSDRVTGPYIDKGLAFTDHDGLGCNVSAAVLPDGRYALLLSETRAGEVYIANSLDGPWEYQGQVKIAADGFNSSYLRSNMSLLVRPDGSFLIVARRGFMMLSTNGVMGPYKVQGPSIWPHIEGLNNDNAEDPVIWYSGGQYHITVNWWDARKAYHLTSPDGITNWKNMGLAYDPKTDFIRYTDGTVNHWNKIERPAVVIENGHVTHFSFAVLDVEKDQENGNDNHGSKIIVIPFDGAAFDADMASATAASQPKEGDADFPKPTPCGRHNQKIAAIKNAKYNRSPKAMAELNTGSELAAKLADGKQVFWSDVNQVFLRPDGKINPDLMPDLMPDLIHPNAAGAEAAAEALEPLLTQLMGAAPKTVYLSDLDLSRMCQGLGTPHKDKSVDNKPLSIGGKAFARGIGTHSESYFDLTIHPGAEKFSAWVGVDDEVGKNGGVEFMLYDQQERIWASGIMRGGDAAKSVEVDLKGRTRLVLVVTDGGDGFGYDHADWADARVTGSGDAPLVTHPPVEPAVILTSNSGPQPRINGARVFGVRPGSPFLFTIPATGERPMTFSARDLPTGLTLDAASGRITGKLTNPGRHKVLLTASNKHSKDSKPLEILCGDQIALTPPMGWNSYNYLNANATEKIMRDVADAFVAKDLINHGWTYINTDFGWNTGELVDPVTLALQPDPKKYSDFPGMCQYIHSLGLKVGLYSSPWTRGYSGFIGESALDAKRTKFHPDTGHLSPFLFEEQDVAQWLRWDIDCMKYDWCPIDLEVWAKDMQDGSKAVGLFNRGFYQKSGTIQWSDLKITGKWQARDLWRQQDLGVHEGKLSLDVSSHGCMLLKIWPLKSP
ncbi:MAG: NPCBM/NEW2 domain-containing protein [Verrucomicrobia bacterium]|nr:NPCBM/NEW2 domain-containing protein [Verrucomicrobiota bacterium]